MNLLLVAIVVAIVIAALTLILSLVPTTEHHPGTPRPVAPNRTR